MVLVTFVTSPSLSQACDKYPVKPGELVREYQLPNGLTYREYDLDGKPGADWGTATPPGIEWPLFYGKGFDDPSFFNSLEQPFVAVMVWRDKGGKGHCEDIVLEYVREDRKPWDPDRPNKFEIRYHINPYLYERDKHA